MKTALLYVKLALAQLVKLSNPVADAALVGLVVKLLPFIHVSTTRLVEYLAATGLVAAYLQRQLAGVGEKVAAEKTARAKKK